MAYQQNGSGLPVPQYPGKGTTAQSEAREMRAEKSTYRQPYSHSPEGATTSTIRSFPTSDRYPATSYQSNNGNSNVGPPIRLADERTSSTASNVRQNRGSYYQVDAPTVNEATTAEGNNWAQYQPPLMVHPTTQTGAFGAHSSVYPTNTPQAAPNNVATTSAYPQTLAYRHGESYAFNNISASQRLNPNSNTPQHQSAPPELRDQPHRQYYQQQHQRGIVAQPIAARPPTVSIHVGGPCQCQNHGHIRYHDAPVPVPGIYTIHTVTTRTIRVAIPHTVNASHAHPLSGSALLVSVAPGHTNVVVSARAVDIPTNVNVAVLTQARPVPDNVGAPPHSASTTGRMTYVRAQPVQGAYTHPPPSNPNTPADAGGVYNREPYPPANTVPGSSSGAEYAESHADDAVYFKPGNSEESGEEEEGEEEEEGKEGMRIKEEEMNEDFEEESDEEVFSQYT